MRSGGKGANQAVASALAGARAVMVGAVGADHAGRAQLDDLARFGVDTAHVRIIAELPTGVAFITVTPDAENAIVVALGANGAVNAILVREALRGEPDAAVIVAQAEAGAAGVAAAAACAVECGARLVLNAAPVLPLDSETLRHADPLVVNEHEAVELAGGTAVAAGAPAEDAEGLARLLRDRTRAGSVVITLGSRGAAAATADGTLSVPSPRVDAVDTTGAGDTFVGTLAAALASGERLGAAVELACAAAARCATWLGTRPPRVPPAVDAIPPNRTGKANTTGKE
jgi:ribokinase